MPITDLTDDEAVPPHAVVIRFRPSTTDRVLETARNNHALEGTEDEPRYFCSVFVDIEADDPEDPGTIQGLLEAAQLSNMRPPPQNKYYFVTKADEILGRGFAFKKDRYTGEHLKHYSVDLGADPSIEDAERFLEAFDQEKGKKPWPKS